MGIEDKVRLRAPQDHDDRDPSQRVEQQCPRSDPPDVARRPHPRGSRILNPLQPNIADDPAAIAVHARGRRHPDREPTIRTTTAPVANIQPSQNRRSFGNSRNSIAGITVCASIPVEQIAPIAKIKIACLPRIGMRRRRDPHVANAMTSAGPTATAATNTTSTTPSIKETQRRYRQSWT